MTPLEQIAPPFVEMATHPRRLRVMPGTAMLDGRGEVLSWRA
jgi:hypothetical protein